jgi:exodeoxyribonuclease V alpha subunit
VSTFDPVQALAEGFATHIETWSRALGAPPGATEAARQAALALSLASSEGHVCWPLAELVAAQPGQLANTEAWAQALHASGVVGRASAPAGCPMVLDDEGRLYLHRDFDHERALARRLLQAARPDEATDRSAEITALLRLLFPPSAPGQADWQQLAAALALRQRLLVISGGPGTGKTTTVVQLLALLLASQPGCRIALAAPTGKAAARMAEALQARAAHLPAALLHGLPTQASTVHRLLGPTGTPGLFRHHAGQPLPIDALIVDEASMLDLALARRLLDAVPAHARIVLLGDKDQLAAVESGAVFSDLSANPALSDAARTDLAAWCAVPLAAIQPPAAPAGATAALPDSAVWLTQNHRFAADSPIGLLARAVQAGRSDSALALLRSSTGNALRWWPPTAGGTAYAESSGLKQVESGGLQHAESGGLQHAESGYADYIATLLQHPADPAAAHAAFNRFRLLCALRGGPSGVDAANLHLARHAREHLAGLQAPGSDPHSPSFVGRPVMVLRNDETLGLFNGDIGITLPAAEGGEPLVWFADAASPGGYRAVAAARLPAHETALAMTVHKAQGSEFDTVMLLLPTQPSRVLTRELLYTAITRARQSVWLAAGADRVAEAVATPTRRYSGLQTRLQEAAAGPGGATTTLGSTPG